jgi:hypothetical protein
MQKPLILLIIFAGLGLLKGFFILTHQTLNRKIKIIVDLSFLLAALLTLIPLLFNMQGDYEKFVKKEISGHITRIDREFYKGTSFFVDPGDVNITLVFHATGISEGDSFFKPKNGNESSYQFFKKDSTGSYKEIRWVPDKVGEDKWEFK